MLLLRGAGRNVNVQNVPQLSDGSSVAAVTGLCALTPNNECWDHCYLAYPNSATDGEVTNPAAVAASFDDNQYRLPLLLLL